MTTTDRNVLSSNALCSLIPDRERKREITVLSSDRMLKDKGLITGSLGSIGGTEENFHIFMNRSLTSTTHHMSFSSSHTHCSRTKTIIQANQAENEKIKKKKKGKKKNNAASRSTHDPIQWRLHSFLRKMDVAEHNFCPHRLSVCSSVMIAGALNK